MGNIFKDFIIKKRIKKNCQLLLHYYPVPVKLERCVGRGNAFIILSNKLCVPNKTEDLNMYVFNKITGINESKSLTKIYHANVKVNLMEDNVKNHASVKQHYICKKNYLESCYL